jgi:hypothetical protein
MDTNAHAYEIVYFLGSAQFFIDNVLIHTFRPGDGVIPTGTMLSAVFTLPFTAHAIQTGANPSAVLNVWAGMILRLGRVEVAPLFKNLTATLAAAKTGPGTLRTVTFNSWTTGCTVTLYDNTTAAAPIIATIAPTNGAGTSAVQQPFTLNYGIDFYTGLSVAISGTCNITVNLD